MLKDNIYEKKEVIKKDINPLVVVKKNNGKLILCLDARHINKYTAPQ